MPSKTTKKFSPEVRHRAVRMLLDHEAAHPSRWDTILSIAVKIGCTGQTLNEWVRKAERDTERRPGPITEIIRPAEIARAREPRVAPRQRDLPHGEDVFCAPLTVCKQTAVGQGAGARPPVQAIIAFIDDSRDAHGVQPICRVLLIAPSIYHAHAAQQIDPTRCSTRVQRDGALMPLMERVLDENLSVYGVRRSGGSYSARASRWPAARRRG